MNPVSAASLEVPFRRIARVGSVVSGRVDGKPASRKRVRLLHATFRQLVESGLEHLTLSAIADRVGVSKAIVLYYFGSKEDLLHATFSWLLSEASERVRKAASVRAGSLEERVRGFLNTVFPGARASRDFFLAYQEVLVLAARNQRFRHLVVEFRRKVEASGLELLGAERSPREPGGESLLPTVRALQALLEGGFARWLLESPGDPVSYRRLLAAVEEAARVQLALPLGCPGSGWDPSAS